MASDIWTITPLEFSQAESQFFSLFPQNGYLNGQQVREHFVKSGLNPQTLGQIWALADVNRDGQMDKFEFAVAVALIRRCLSGNSLPPTLPPSMRSIIPPTTYATRQAPPAIPPMNHTGPPIIPNRQTTVAPTVSLKECSDWSLPLPSKNKYRQEFYNNDKNNQGFLNGVQARYILSQSGLANQSLANIWNLSDVNKDGVLSVDEFCVAMHLIDMHKQGYILPSILPPELMDLFPSTRKIEESPQKPAHEDKFMDSYQRSQAELERRRQIAREEEERLRAETKRREQEEQERREKERQEIEKRRQAELEAERQRESEREKARQEEEARKRAEREAIRKKMEDERLKELEKIRIRDMENQKQAEDEKTAQIKQRHKNMSFQFQALQEKTDSLNSEVTKAREEIIAITSEIEGMRTQRDEKLATMNQLQLSHQQLSIQCERISHEHLQLQSECRKSSNRSEEIDQLRKAIVDRQNELTKCISEAESSKNTASEKAKLYEEKKQEFDESSKKFKNSINEHNDLVQKASDLQKKFLEKLNIATPSTNNVNNGVTSPKYQSSFDDSFVNDFNTKATINTTSNNAPFGFDNQTTTVSSTVDSSVSVISGTPTKYRALYDFEARSEDELSLQPGDIILVFESQNTEPGWLAGQVRGKVGWFPASFAEPINNKSSIPNVVTPPSLARIEEEKEEPASLTTVSQPNYELPPTTTELYEVPPENQPTSFPTYDAPPVIENNTPAIYDAPPGDVSNDKVLAVGVALYRWNAQKEGDLSFNKGDEIEVLEKSEMKWRGRLLKNPSQKGWFPKSYLKIKEENLKTESDDSSKQSEGEWYVALWAFEAVEPTDLSINPGDKIRVIDRQEQWWKGVLNGQTGIFPATYVKKLADDEENKSDAATEPVKHELARALAPFEATADNQISLKVGDIVKIRSTSPAGWWEGEITLSTGEHKTGWFPGNYVEIIKNGT